MSSEREFEQFLRAAREVPPPTTEEARRVEAGLAERLVWAWRVPDRVATALRSPGTVSRRDSRSAGWWIRFASIFVSAIAISIASYSVTRSQSGSSDAAFASASAGQNADYADPGAHASAEKTSAETKQVTEEKATDVLTLGDPSMLPPAAEPGSSVPSRTAVDGARTPSPARSAMVPTTAIDPRRTGSLNAELALLATTTDAIRAQAPERALSLIDQHARDFPNGALGPEFAAERVLALAALGQRAEACAASARFLSEHPFSPLAHQVRSACDDTRSKP